MRTEWQEALAARERSLHSVLLIVGGQGVGGYKYLAKDLVFKNGKFYYKITNW